MKTKLYYLFAFVLFLLSVIPVDMRSADTKYYIFFLIFILCSALLQKLENVKPLCGIILITAVAVTVIDYEYIFFALPSLLLMLGYRLICDEAAGKKKTDIPYILFNFASRGISLCAVIYALVTSGYKTRMFKAFCGEIFGFIWILLLCVFIGYGFVKNTEQKKDHVNKSQKKVFKDIFVSAVISIVSLLFYIHYSCFYNINPPYIIMCYWSAFIIFVLFYKNRPKQLLLPFKKE